MENKEITIDELKIGDEILTLTQQGKYLKLMELPRRSKTPYKYANTDRYINVKCQVNLDLKPVHTTKYDYVLQKQLPYTYYIKTYNLEAPEEDSPVEKFDLNFKKIWLIKRNSI